MKGIVLAACSFVLVGPAQSIGADDPLAQARKDQARITTLILEKAAKTYYIKYGELPKKLEQLIEPPAGDKSLIEPDKEKLKDPWGKPYQFEGSEVKGQVTIKIWTIAPDGTRIDNAPRKK